MVLNRVLLVSKNLTLSTKLLMSFEDFNTEFLFPYVHNKCKTSSDDVEQSLSKSANEI